MTAVLRSTNFLTFKIPDNKKAHSYFKNVKARYWQLKHYLGFRLKSDEIILPWNTVYDDWRQTLVYIFKDYYKIVYLLFVKIYIIFVTRLKAPSGATYLLTYLVDLPCYSALLTPWLVSWMGCTVFSEHNFRSFTNPQYYEEYEDKNKLNLSNEDV
uniref:Uncharacterized protein n=1 Tax=Rhizophagus irregularis (strain DAOM 181602 / DAOM 197198 / MUCL 43194) TaxID=747089 RepID=U9TL71_RHIID